MEDYAIKVTNVKKRYKLGQIGGGTLTADLQSWWAKVRGKEDPNTKIGEEQRSNGDTFMALNGVNLTVKKGEALGIIGSNGAGKSTLLKLLSRVTAPTEGEIDIYGRITSMLEVGTGFNGEMTGRENVYLNGAILGMTKAEVNAKMDEIIEFSEVREFIDTPVKRYSSGMYVKLAFSVAAHLDSEIMIMDEVLAVGDMAFQKKCLDKMRDAAKKEGRTVLYVSHNMNTIRQLCDRCVVLDKGRCIFEGDVEDAIEIYLQTNVKLENEYIFTKHSPRKVDYFTLNKIKFLNVSKPIFQENDYFDIELFFNSKINLNNLQFRFEIKYQSDSVAGTIFTDKTNINSANNSLKIRIDTKPLVYGKYSFDIVAFQMDKSGNEAFLDSVYPGFFIELYQNKNNDISIEWLHNYYGHSRLNNAKFL